MSKPSAPWKYCTATCAAWLAAVAFIGSAQCGPADTAASPPLAVRVDGNHLVNSKGETLQLRGVNVSGLEFVAVQGWSAGDPWGGSAPDWNALKSWKINVVRLPLNEASWLGRSCSDVKTGAIRKADPGGNYVATVAKSVKEATAAGLYVILDLHLTAPGNYCPRIQTAMADNDNSIAFWASVAQYFKNSPNVVFELFNEPFATQEKHFTGDGWPYLMRGTGGGGFSGFGEQDSDGGWHDVQFNWQGASMQSMLNAVRATGATNVVLVGGLFYSQSLEGWLANQPIDPLKQLGAAWHAYPKFGAAFGTSAASQPNFFPEVYDHAKNLLAAGIPIVISEIGDKCTDGTATSPEITNVTRWADANHVSVIGWVWDTWYKGGDCVNVLIKTAAGKPTDGFGQVFHDWLANHSE